MAHPPWLLKAGGQDKTFGFGPWSGRAQSTTAKAKWVLMTPSRTGSFHA
jgi:hypothetical protein